MEEDLRIEELEKELEEARKRIKVLEGNGADLFLNNFKIPSSEVESLKDSVIDNTHYPLLILDEELRIVFSNKKFHKSFSLSPDEINGEHIYQAGEKQWDIPQLRNVLETILPSKSSMTNFEMQYENSRSGSKYLTLNASEIKLTGSNKKYILLSIEDITQRKKAEIKLEESEQRFHELFYSSTSLLAILSGPDHVVEIANDAIKDVWGKGYDVLGKPIAEVLPEIVDQGIIELLDNVYNTGEAFQADEMPIEHIIDGKSKIIYFDFTYQPQRNRNGEIIGVGVIAHDVTKQAILNDKIKKSEREFRELVDLMPHKISMADAEGNTMFYNQSWLDYVGKDFEEFKNEDQLDIVHPEDKEIAAREIEKCLSESSNMDLELRIRDKDGDYKWHLVKAIPIKEQDGKIHSWISSSTEIQKIKEEEKRKEDFLKLVSHELKTPVTSIKGYVQLLTAMLPKQKDGTDKKFPLKPYLKRMSTQVEKLIRLIAEMLDLSRIEQNELDLKKEKFSLNRHVKEIAEDLSYSNKDIEIKINHELECEVHADRDRIGQVIINFVTNALKYSPDNNQVNIRIFEAEKDKVGVCVQDFGKGIPDKELNNIFKRFYRVSGNKDDTYSGFGIGLYLSNEIIQRHNGNIYVKSEVGKGSEFTFVIPLNHN